LITSSSIEALLKRDSDLCDRVITEDEEIDFLEKQVDQDAVTLLLRFDPVAMDLREVISAMKVGTDLERVGDESVELLIPSRVCRWLSGDESVDISKWPRSGRVPPNSVSGA
jgi:hypothetical protein